MKMMDLIVAVAGGLALAGTCYADTRSSNKDSTSMEQGASPSNPVKQDEERTVPHSQPDVPGPGGTSPRNTTKSPKAGEKDKRPVAKAKGKDKDKEGASRGSSNAPGAGGIDVEQSFK